MSADGESDLTGALLELVRKSVGPDVPIVGTLDLHANITERMLQYADLLVGYHACPHLDSFETGQRAAAGLRQMIEENVRPVTYSRKLPKITIRSPASPLDCTVGWRSWNATPTCCRPACIWPCPGSTSPTLAGL
jgi:microcystin degradation protein MlrC